jgi:ABC-type Fe3+-hydroxamate transport system substrate-binding protein
MKIFLIPLVAAVVVLAGCGDSSSKKTTTAATNAEPKYDTGNPLTAPADYLGAVVQAQKHAEKVIDVSYINQAIQLFQANEGRLPKDLNELVPNYMGKLPVPPYGTKLVYDATAGTVKVVKQ